MQFKKLNLKGYTVYTKSNCPYCNKVKELLANVKPDPIWVNCDEYLVQPDVKEEFLTWIQLINGGISHRTFPIVFYQGKFIGGFTDTEKFYAKENIFLEDVEF